MVSEKPNVSDSGRYSLKDAAKALGIHVKTLQRHTISGDISCQRRKCNGRPIYLGSEIKRFWGACY